MGEGIYIYRWRPKSNRSRSKIYRDYYEPKMERLYSVEKELKTGEGIIKVGFNKVGNKHLFNDAFSGTHGIQKSDLPTIDKLLDNATYLGKENYDPDKKVTKDKKYINKFYYFRIDMHGKPIVLNVARKTYKGRTTYFVYAINKYMRKKKRKQ